MESSLQSVGTRLTEDTVTWLDSMRRRGESRSYVIRKILEQVMYSQLETKEVEVVEIPVLPSVVKWNKA